MKTKIIFEDRDLLVVQKPAGFATQTAKVGQQDVVSELKNYLASPYLGIIHRLDQPVEGLLVFAKNKGTAAALASQLGGSAESELLNKRYYGVFCGKAAEKSGKLVNDLYKNSGGKVVVTEPAQGRGDSRSKRAVLQYDVLRETEVQGVTLSLADIRIDTGRFHQIRAQMAHAGMGLLGDMKYGEATGQAISAQLGVRHVALCAYRLEFFHPATKQRKCFQIKPQGEVFSFFS